ncbi:MAG: TRAP transporter small permease [Rhodospirillaceae bacterium]|jgi:TRAP-type transport system small permease protein|nr:TRAP transporter small permease [Rhodospirillaceae bacterium]MBT7954635.1 TRAP transporter small permease [Rhodospirillaceae bacterium]
MSNSETDGTDVPENSGDIGADYHEESIANNPLDRALAEDYLVPEKVAGIFRQPVRILTVIAALFMLGIASVTIIDVTGRYAFNNPIPGGVEIIEFLLGLTIFSALPLVTVKRAHITVELFDGFMSDGFKRVREVIVLIASAGMIIFITHRMWSTGLDMLENDDISIHLELPTAPLLFILCGLSAVSAITQIYMVWKYVTVDIRQSAEPIRDHHQEEDIV